MEAMSGVCRIKTMINMDFILYGELSHFAFYFEGEMIYIYFWNAKHILEDVFHI